MIVGGKLLSRGDLERLGSSLTRQQTVKWQHVRQYFGDLMSVNMILVIAHAEIYKTRLTSGRLKLRTRVAVICVMEKKPEQTL